MKAFKGLLYGLLLSLVLWVMFIVGAVFVIAEANASPVCERRSVSHYTEHGGLHTDSRYHVARGELPNCDEPSQRDGSDHEDDSRGHWRRDEIGFNCTWRGCG